MLKKVEGENNLVKDSYSKAILSTDTKGASDYKKRREERRANQLKIEQQQKDINILNAEVKELRDSMNLILEKLSGK